MRKKGFTLLELMIVVVILGILSAFIVPKVISYPDKTKRKKAAIEINNIIRALDLFYTDTGKYPTTAEGLETLVKDPGNIDNYNPEGYIEKTTDPWGNPYVYICPGVNNKFDIESYGKDGEDGGTGLDEDIESWNLEE